MSEPTTDERLSSLRADVMKAGEAVQQLRDRTVRTTILVLTLPVLLVVLVGLFTGWPEMETFSGFQLLLFVFGLGWTLIQALLVGLLLAFPLAVAYRRSCRSSLRHRLAQVPNAELAAVLVPLRNEKHGDTRKLAASLIRDLLVTDTELVPAEPTPGSGTEPTPAAPPND